MEKFGMSFGGGPSRKDLLETVEVQKKQLVQYQSRFKDVVRAYKSLLKEKEALEASLRVLSVSQDLDLDRDRQDLDRQDRDRQDLDRQDLDRQDRDRQDLDRQDLRTATSDLLEDGSSLHSEDSLETAADTPADTTREDQNQNQNQEEQAETAGQAGSARLKSDSDASESSVTGAEPLQATPPPGMEAERRVVQLRGQLSTLTGALATVTQEKSRMEANFLADKRQLKQEVEALQERLAAAEARQEAELHALQTQLSESRARVITQQHERQREQDDHGQQLRELQRLLQEERDLHQDAQLRLQDAAAAATLATRDAERRAEAQEDLDRIREERDQLRRRLKTIQEDQNRPDPRLEQLQKDLKDLKDLYQDQVQNQNRKVGEAEERSQERAQSAESRAAVLELRVSELSELLGSCEKSRRREQQAAQRQRERLLQLDAENKTLAMAAAIGRTNDLGTDEAALDVAALKDKLQRVKKLLTLAAQRDPDVNIQDLQDPEAVPSAERAAACQRELRQVKEEFERYKLRAQVVLKNKNTKDGCQARELEEVRAQLGELREKYIDLRVHCDEAEERHAQQLEQRQQQAAAQQLAHRQEAERAATSHRDELQRLEAELHKHRERTMALLDDKDRELERLRAAAAATASTAAASDSAAEGAFDHDDDIIRQATPTESTLLLYAEQLARKEVEAGVVRRQKNRLEEDLHQLQARLVANGERHDEEAEQLRSQIDKLEREQRREGANVEYLKNVIYRFLTLQDAAGRHQTLGAILTVLHFSPEERRHVLRLQAPPWWR